MNALFLMGLKHFHWSRNEQNPETKAEFLGEN